MRMIDEGQQRRAPPVLSHDLQEGLDLVPMNIAQELVNLYTLLARKDILPFALKGVMR